MQTLVCLVSSQIRFHTANDISDPGCGVDIPSFLYSLSFATNKYFPKLLPKQPELLKYLEDVAESYEVSQRIQCNTMWRTGVWDEYRKRWVLYLQDTVTGEQFEYECQMVVVCVGNLGEPKPCTIPGADKFSGSILHTARWDNTVDLTDKRVAIIGNGAAATQFVPAAARKVKSLHQFIRVNHRKAVQAF